MSEFGGLWKHSKHPACTVGWVARLCRCWLSPGKATRISRGRNICITYQEEQPGQQTQALWQLWTNSRMSARTTWTREQPSQQTQPCDDESSPTRLPDLPRAREQPGKQTYRALWHMWTYSFKTARPTRIRKTCPRNKSPMTTNHLLYKTAWLTVRTSLAKSHKPSDDEPFPRSTRTKEQPGQQIQAM